jgi:ribosomal protein L21E
MSKQITSQFAVGARVRIVRVTFPDSSSHAEFVGKTGTVQTHVTSFSAVVVLVDDGSTRVCSPENLELIERE